MCWKIILSEVILKKSNKGSWWFVTSECGYSHYDNVLYIRSLVNIAPTQATIIKWCYQHLFWASWSTSQWKVNEIFFLSLMVFEPSFLYINDCHRDYSDTLTSQINLLRLISSKLLRWGLFHLHIQHTQHQTNELHGDHWWFHLSFKPCPVPSDRH